MLLAPLLLLLLVPAAVARLSRLLTLSTAASLLVALTVTPALCRILFRGRFAGAEGRDAPLVRWLKSAYEPVLRGAVRFRRTVLAGGALATLATLWIARKTPARSA